MARAAINRLISSAARHQRTLRDHGYGWCISHQQTEQTRAADWMTQGSDQGLGRACQDAGPQTENDHHPGVDLSVRGIDSLLASAERS